MKNTTLPGYQINNKYLYEKYTQIIGAEFWTQEFLEYNDCFYRNIHNYEYIAVFDIDEVIVPKTAYNWKQMIDQLNVCLILYEVFSDQLINFKLNFFSKIL